MASATASDKSANTSARNGRVTDAPRREARAEVGTGATISALPRRGQASGSPKAAAQVVEHAHRTPHAPEYIPARPNHPRRAEIPSHYLHLPHPTG